METVQGWMYLRLSRDDLGGGESESITNQREYILQYMKNHDDILLGGEFIDDGGFLVQPVKTA